LIPVTKIEKYRYERKYYLANNRLEELRARLKPFVEPDIFTGLNEFGISEYTVRSVYYDTPFMKYYEEKKEGVELRNKFRIRVYDTEQPDSIAFLEIKKKVGVRIGKHRAKIPYSSLNEVLQLGNLEKHLYNKTHLYDGQKFLYHFYKNSLSPLNLVTYEREAYMGKFDKGVRITFDKNVRTTIYPQLDKIFGEQGAKYLSPEYFVLEIKYHDEIPRWALSIIEEFKLNLKAISKYADGLESHIMNSSHRFSPVSYSRIGLYKPLTFATDNE